jgi:hypothetical protein
MSRHLNPDRLPPQRVVVRFDFPGRRAWRFWLVLDPGNPSVCLKDPGFDTDLVVTAETTALYQIYFGRLEMSEAKLSGSLKVEGPPALAGALPTWFRGSDFAPTARLSVGGR